MSSFVSSLPELTEGAKTRRSKKQASEGIVHKFFREQGKVVLCKWSGRLWVKFGEVPHTNLTKEQADKIIASVAAQEAPATTSGAGAAPAVVREVPESELLSSLEEIEEFVARYRAVDRSTFAFTPEHDSMLSKADTATDVLLTAAKGSAQQVFEVVFGTDAAAAGLVSAESKVVNLRLCAELIDVLTTSIENMVKLEKSAYSSDVLVKCGKIRLQVLQTLQLIASNEPATRIVVRESHRAAVNAQKPAVAANSDELLPSGTGGGGGRANMVDHGPLSLDGVIVSVLNAVSAKFDFVAVQVAINLLRNWTIFPDEEFRSRLIVHHKAMSVLAKLFAHKDANVAGTAIATVRHICSNVAGKEVLQLDEDDIVNMEQFAESDQTKVHPVVRVEFGRCACVLICQAATVGSSDNLSEEEVRRLAGIAHRLSTPACLKNIVFLLAGPHQQLHAEVASAFKALGWIDATTGLLDAKFEAMDVVVNGQPTNVSSRMHALGLISSSKNGRKHTPAS